MQEYRSNSVSLYQIDADKILSQISNARRGIFEAIQKHRIVLGTDQILLDTLLFKAVRFAEPEIVRMLLEKGASVSTVDENSCTPFHYALRILNNEIIELLLKKVHKSNEKTIRELELTPLAIACLENDSLAVAELIKHGVNVDGLAVPETSSLCNDIMMHENDNYPVNWSGYTCLHLAAKYRRVRIVEILLKNGANVHLHNSRGLTALHLAVESNSLEIASSILSSQGNVDVNTVDHYGRTPLMLAVMYESNELVKLLLRHGANANQEDIDGLTALYFAVEKNNTEIVESILESQCGRNNGQCVRNNSLKTIIVPEIESNNTLLHAAIENGSIPIFLWLVCHGANMNAKNSEGLTPLHMAAKCQFFSDARFLRLLISYNFSCCKGRDAKGHVRHYLVVSSKNDKEDTESLIGILAEYRDIPIVIHVSPSGEFESNKRLLSVNTVDHYCNTPLHYAIGNHKFTHSIIVPVLLNAGADVNIPNRENETPVHKLARNSMRRSVDVLLRKKCIDAMLIASVNSKVNDNPTDDEGFSHFHAACIVDNSDIVRMYLENGVDVNAAVCSSSVLWPGYTPLHFAAEYNSLKVIQLLINSGASVNTGFVATPLHIAIRRGCSEAVELFRQNGVDFNFQNPYNGNNAYHEFVLREMLHYEISVPVSYKDIWNQLLNSDCDIDSPNMEGLTPLNMACKLGKLQSVHFFLYVNADINKADNQGNLPLQNLMNSGRQPQETVEFILSKLRNHIAKLLALGSPVDVGYTNLISDMFVENSELNEFYQLCVKEVDIIKNTVVAGNTSLYTCLMPNAECRGENIYNGRNYRILCRMLTEPFAESNISEIIRRLFQRKYAFRIKYFKNAKRALNSVTGLPDVCCSEICSYLLTQDLKTLTSMSCNDSEPVESEPT